MKRLLWLAMVVSTPASAVPIYLTCVFGNPDYPIEITVDEEGSWATVYLRHSGYRKTSRATFTADTVMFSDDVEPYELSRIDLKIIRGERGSRRMMAGQCAIKETPKRAF